MKNIYLLVLVLGVLVSSCELPDNVNPKAPTEVLVETILSNALRDGLDLIDNLGNYSRLMTQYVSQVIGSAPLFIYRCRQEKQVDLQLLVCLRQ